MYHLPKQLPYDGGTKRREMDCIRKSMSKRTEVCRGRDDLSETDIFHDGANGMERCPGSSGENITGDTKGELSPMRGHCCLN